MYKYISWLIPAAFIFVFVIQPCFALELIISDSGRNTAWSRSLNIGDDFGGIGADDNPVGGIIPHTTAIHQVLVPMPNKIELEQMSQKQESIWVENFGDLLKDRVHIATTNGATIFEIRLLQDAPQPSAATMSWQENPRTGRFAHMSYQAIGRLVKHLQDREEPVRITAALADSGCTAFAQAIDSWKPYSETFRRVDLVDGRASLTQIRPVISVLGGKRVRLFHTTGIPMTPAMTIGRREVADNLLKSYPHLNLYALTLNESESVPSDQYAQTPWMDSLSGSRAFTVKRRQYVDGKAIEQVLVGDLTGQDFRDPIAGLDPENSDYQTGESMMKMGIIAPVSDQPVIPVLPRLSMLGAAVGREALKPKAEGAQYTMGHRMLVDIPGVGWIGEPRKNDWGKMLDSDKTTIHVRHMGPGKDKWAPKVPGVDYVTLPSKWSADSADKLLKPHIISAFSQGKDVHIIIDSNITMTRHLLPLPNRSENKWAADVTSYVAAHKPGSYNGILAAHSNGTIAPKYIKDFSPFSAFLDSSPRGDDGLSWTTRAGKHGKVFIIRGKSDAPSLSWFKSPEKLTQTGNISLIKYQEKADWGTTHSRLQNVETTGAWEIRSANGVKTVDAKLRTLIKPAFSGKTDYRINDIMTPSQLSNKHRDQISNNILKTPSSRLSYNMAKRIPSGTNLVFDRPIRLDRSVKSILDDRSINVTYNPTGYKKAPSGSLRLSNFEAPRILGDITRNSGPTKYYSMKEGYRVSQKHMDDFPDFKRMRSSDSVSSNPYSMKTGFNDLQRTRFDSTDFGLMNKSKLLPSQDIGGVMLNKSARVEGGGNTLNTGNISLIFQNSAGVIDFMKLQRFSTALWATYLSVEGPGISIDPVSESFKEFGDKHRVRYIGQVYNTEIGKVMRETDHLMKRWAIGTHRPDIENFLSPDEINEKSKNIMGLNRASRFWFVPDGFTFKRSDNMLLFSGGRMTLQTEYLDNNPKGEKNEANELFAQWFTENYNLVAERYPIFRELFEYAQLVSLSTYLRENRVPMLWFLMANREIILTEDSIDKVDQLVKKSGYKWYVKIYGGVELQLGEALRNEKSYENDPALQVAEDVLRDNTSDKDRSNAPFVFSANDTAYTVTSKNTLKLFNSSAEGDTIQTDLALVDQYHEDERGGAAADKKEWNLIAPHLELIRYYSPELQTRAQFGDGWHLLVPFRLETEKQTSLPGAGFIPKRVVMTNLLSGMREVLELEGRDGLKLQYAPAESGGLTKNLTRFADGSWRLQDILGAKFVFDQEGDLRQITLRDDHTVKFKLGSKKYSKRVPGYSVKYNYNTSKVNGQDLKVLTSIKQGGHTARIDWLPNNTVLQIAGIRVLQHGKARPVEVLGYEYGQDGILARVTSQSGRYVSFRYEDDHMRVAAIQK